MGGEPERRLDVPGVLDAVAERAPGLLDTTEMGCDDPTRIPLGAEITSQLPVEVDKLACVRLRLCEVAGAHFELGDMEHAAGGRADAVELDRQREQVEQEVPGAGELSGVEERHCELTSRALVGLADVREPRLQLDPLLEQLLVETFPGEELRDAEL